MLRPRPRRAASGHLLDERANFKCIARMRAAGSSCGAITKINSVPSVYCQAIALSDGEKTSKLNE